MKIQRLATEESQCTFCQQAATKGHGIRIDSKTQGASVVVFCDDCLDLIGLVQRMPLHRVLEVRAEA